MPEIQEVISRVMDAATAGSGEFSGSEYDPIYLLPPPKYEEFIIKLTSNTVGANAVLKSLRRFILSIILFYNIIYSIILFYNTPVIVSIISSL